MAAVHYAFDAYGTLFDVHAAVRRHAATIGPGAQALSDLWRSKQLEYTWVRTLAGTYRDFWELTAEALDFAFARFPDLDRSWRDRLLEAYLTLDCYPEVPAVLRSLKDRGARLCILSNGSPRMLETAVRSAGLGPLLDDIFSVDAARRFKTDPATYALVTASWGVSPSEVSFQSSNRWDIAGATRFGFRCTWINRTGQPDEYGDLPPERIVETLAALIDTP
ncbi:MAG: haloacid dehalogenase type II [Rhizobiaceae bacterium]